MFYDIGGTIHAHSWHWKVDLDVAGQDNSFLITDIKVRPPQGLGRVAHNVLLVAALLPNISQNLLHIIMRSCTHAWAWGPSHQLVRVCCYTFDTADQRYRLIETTRAAQSLAMPSTVLCNTIWHSRPQAGKTGICFQLAQLLRQQHIHVCGSVCAHIPSLPGRRGRHLCVAPCRAEDLQVLHREDHCHGRGGGKDQDQP